MKPSLFLGSSTEALPVAYTIQQQLAHDARVSVWNQGLFGLGRATLEQLVSVAAGFDFAAFVLAADDMVIIHNERHPVARDNVILELGLFTGRLGRDRVFVVAQTCQEQLRLPSDLDGVTRAQFDWPPERRLDPKYHSELHSALGPAVNEIRAAIHSKGFQEDAFNPLSGGMIFILRLLNEHGRSLRGIAALWSEFNQKQADKDPTYKAAKYACQCLEAFGLAKSFGGDEYAITALGKGIIESGRLKQRFHRAFAYRGHGDTAQDSG